jgi:hypothetical protein
MGRAANSFGMSPFRLECGLSVSVLHSSMIFLASGRLAKRCSFIVRPLGGISVGLRLQPHHPAGPSLRIAFLLDRPAHSQSSNSGRQKFFPNISFSVAASKRIIRPRQVGLTHKFMALYLREASQSLKCATNAVATEGN